MSIPPGGSAVPVSDLFTNACTNFESYPCSLIHKTTFLSNLESYEKRLKDEKLLFGPESKAFVAFRDLNPDEQSMSTNLIITTIS